MSQTDRAYILPQHVPVVGTPEDIIGIIHWRANGIADFPSSIRGSEREKFGRTLMALGLTEEDGTLTRRGHDLIDHPDRQRAFRDTFNASRIGRAWTFSSGAVDIASVDPAAARRFIERFTRLTTRDRELAAQLISSWVVWCQRPAPSLPSRPPAPGPSASTLKTTQRWPPTDILPHNEGNESVGRIVLADLAQGPILVVVGFAALAELIPFLSDQLRRSGRPIRLLFGNEPFQKTRPSWEVETSSLPDEVRDYWLDWGFSVTRSAEVLQARTVVESLQTEVRIARSRQHPLHAKIYMSEVAITLGSSNFTTNGLKDQSEANARFLSGDPRYPEAQRLAEGLWEDAVDYKNGLLDLLDRLLKEVEWPEALGRACAEILEGRWAENYMPPVELAALDRPLWPHQRLGITQAIWCLQNTGSVLIADATGSGKTRMGAWLVRAVHEWRARHGMGLLPEYLVIAPQAVTAKWETDLHESRVPLKVSSSGILSSSHAHSHKYVRDSVEDCQLLVVDEAHNYFNPDSNRTQRLLASAADHAVLFTATPISRRGSDLLALVDLLGADHFSDDAHNRLGRISKYRAAESPTSDDDRDEVRHEIQSFMVRRTRDQLNHFVEADPEAYRLPSKRVARYPKISTHKYSLPLNERDALVAERIAELADELLGVTRVGDSIVLSDLQREQHVSERAYLQALAGSAKALARHSVLDCLRSSRVALLEHIVGTEEVQKRLRLTALGRAKAASGNMLKTLADAVERLPDWKLRDVSRLDAPPWLVDADARRQACEEERKRYTEIADLTEKLSDAREQAKCEHLAKLCKEGRKVIAFDGHTITLHVFKPMLDRLGVKSLVLTGDDGKRGKQQAEEMFGLSADDVPVVALCSDAFSEGLNLQKTSAVVHLDHPTVIREAEQRAGRIDRMDSPHEEISVWFPDETGGFTPRRRDLLRERHRLVAELIGANLRLPDETMNDPVQPEDLREEVSASDPRDLFDGFRTIRSMVAPGGLVGSEVYARMRATQERYVACVGLVRATSHWGFFAVGNESREAPRWVLLDTGMPPETDIRVISARLEERLRGPTEKLSLLDTPNAGVDRLLEELIQYERRLLPRRRQRLLDLAEEVLGEWYLRAEDDRDEDRVAVLRRCQKMLVPWPDEREVPHLRAISDTWGRLLKPYRQEALAGRSRRERWGLFTLREPLFRKPMGTDDLRAAFREVPLIPPMSRRVVAMIIGVPATPT